MAIAEIPLTQINPARVLLRPVDQHSLAYMQIRDTVGPDGKRLLASITVRPDPRDPGNYEVVDGMYRYTAFVELGIYSIPCIILEGVTDAECLSLQIRANALRKETTRTEFAKQLRRIQQAIPGIPMTEIAVLCGNTAKWVKEQLGLLDLIKEAQLRVDRDEMPVENAYRLSRIPPNHQRLYLEHAMVLPVPEFKRIAAEVIRGFMEAARNGKLEARYVAAFKPQPYLRPLKKVLAEIETSTQGVRYVTQDQARTPLDAWRAALEWAASLDAESIADQERKAAIRLKQIDERAAHEVNDDSDPPA